jgi:hypothetical protein
MAFGPNTDIEEPIRTIQRTDIAEPMVTKLQTETLDPERKKLLKLNDELMVTNSTTEAFINEPVEHKPHRDKPEFERMNARMDIELPIAHMSNELILPPARKKLRILQLDPKLTKFKTLNELPDLMNDLILNDEPKVNASDTDTFPWTTDFLFE